LLDPLYLKAHPFKKYVANNTKIGSNGNLYLTPIIVPVIVKKYPTIRKRVDVIISGCDMVILKAPNNTITIKIKDVIVPIVRMDK